MGYVKLIPVRDIPQRYGLETATAYRLAKQAGARLIGRRLMVDRADFEAVLPQRPERMDPRAVRILEALGL